MQKVMHKFARGDKIFMRLPFSKPIDKLLGGGLEGGCITTFYGPPGSGKTQIALCASSTAAKFGRVCFIDTEGGFSPERVAELSGSEDVLERILLFDVNSWEEQKKVIRKLENVPCSLIVVDSFVTFWRLEINEKNIFETNQELARQLAILNKIARAKKIPVLLTSQVYEDLETKRIEVSSRNIIKWWSKYLVELLHAGRANFRIAVLRKAKSQPEGRKIEFEISKNGLKEATFRLF